MYYSTNCKKTHIRSSQCQVYCSFGYDWVQSFGGVPDERHTDNMSENVNGLPEDVNILAKTKTASSLCFRIILTDCLEVSWETLLLGWKLIKEIPNRLLRSECSKGSFVTFLQYAGEALKYTHVIVCFKSTLSHYEREGALIIH